MSVWALVPVKSRHLAKRRLCRALAPSQRVQLTETMLRALLTALSQVRGLAGVAVVTPEALDLDPGPRLIADPGGGLNAALDRGIRVLTDAGASGVVVLPADIPFATAAEIEYLLAAGRDSPVVVVPDRGGTGTNALWLAPPTCLAPAFGPDSFQRHLRLAEECGLAARALPLPGIGFDIDTPADLAHLQARTAARAADGVSDAMVAAE